MTRPAIGTMFNVPNQLTCLRILLSVLLFALIAYGCYVAALVTFIIAALTDWLDGYWARKFNQITTLGRILDPFADKVIVCGTFIFLAVAPAMLAEPWGLRAWMVAVIVCRELLVTALRSFLEERGSDFSANMSGKLKMVLQSVAAAASLAYLNFRQPLETGGFLPAPDWVWWLTVLSIWSAVVLTIYSGAVYVGIAWKLLLQENAEPDA
jgi:CDP-diacylglycerol---glycerol-3-phosphate 3-phosphatidyltransferase